MAGFLTASFFVAFFGAVFDSGAPVLGLSSADTNKFKAAIVSTASERNSRFMICTSFRKVLTILGRSRQNQKLASAHRFRNPHLSWKNPGGKCSRPGRQYGEVTSGAARRP